MALGNHLSTALKAATLGTDPQSFLDATWVPWLVSSAPAAWRRQIALRVLGWSPHYVYSAPEYHGLSRSDVLEREFKRNIASRRAIGERVLRPLLSPGDTVLDYGCGPGYMLPYLAGLVRTVYGVDLSRGALACGSLLNGTTNSVLLHTSEAATIPAGSVDLACSFAVFQHIGDAVLADALRFIRRTLRPGGRLIAHVVIEGEGWRTEMEWRQDASLAGRLKLRYGLNCFTRTEAQVRSLLGAAGFAVVNVQPLRPMFPEPFDDVCTQHLVTASVPV